jgi:hypothetical protein
MCEHCTCQTFGPIEDLHADHELMLQMIGHIRSLLKAGGDGDDITGEIGPLLSLLRTHNAKEEAGIYAMLAQNEPAYIARLTAEHGPIELLLGALAHSGEGRAFIADGLHRLQDHIFTDEQDAYPFALQMLPPGQWDMVDDAHVNMSS